MATAVEEVMAQIGPMWAREVRPLLGPAACIGACRTLSEVLDYFHVPHGVMVVNALIANDLAFEHVGLIPINEWPKQAWTLGIDRLQIGPGWPGHVVINVENRLFIDLDAQQFDRPHRQIRSGGPLVRLFDEFDVVTRKPDRSDVSGLSMFHTSMEQGHYLWAPDSNDVSYKEAPDWKEPYHYVIGEAIRRIKGRTPRPIVKIR